MDNLTPENTSPAASGNENNQAEITEAPEEFNGSWERKGRSITAAAVSGLLGIGVVYFNAQSFLVLIFALIYTSMYSVSPPDNVMDNLDAVVYEYKTPILIALTLSQYLFMLAPSFWVVKKWHTHKTFKYLRIQNFSFKETVLAIFITLSLLPFCYFLSYLILDLFEIPEVFRSMGEEIFTAHSFSEFLVLVFVIAVTPAICEEVFFRGYVQRTLERTAGMKSFIITGVLFGLFHMQPLGLVTLSVLGVLFSFFYFRSKSIFPSSAAHFTNNFIALLLLYSQSQASTVKISESENISLFWVIGSLIIAGGLMYQYIKITSVPFEERQRDYFRW